MAKKRESELEKMLTEGVIGLGSAKQWEYDRIKFNIPDLDVLTGGGIPQKRFTIMTGQTSSGKSYLASQAIKSVQQTMKADGVFPVWIDTEMSWDKNWMLKCGLDLDRIYVIQPDNAEQAFLVARAALNDGCPLVVLDSVAGLLPAYIDDEDFGYNPMAWQARFVNQSIPKLFPHLKNGSAMIWINQVRASMGPVSLDNMPGGVGQTFFSHMLLQVKREGWINEKDNVAASKKIGFEMRVRSRKSKVGGEVWDQCVVPFKIDGGIDLLEMTLRVAVAKDIIVRRGAWYNLGDAAETKVSGMGGVRKYVLEHPEYRAWLEERVDVDEALPDIDLDPVEEIGTLL
jgi:protein RecA|tara:strand:- start:8957 stop:9985 length:1029 start_codon:yes stop_codon:yes gene_type:complete